MAQERDCAVICNQPPESALQTYEFKDEYRKQYNLPHLVTHPARLHAQRQQQSCVANRLY